MGLARFSKVIIFIPLLLASALFSTERPSHISEELWSQTSPYLIPDDHPIKSALDQLFIKCRYRIIETEESLYNAGFTSFGERHTTGIYVVEHKKIRGFLLKLYLDSQNMGATDRFLKRIRGSHLAREIIREKGATKSLVVPQKWLYLIPENSAPALLGTPKPFILVVERMKILDRAGNRKKWKSPKLSTHFLRLYFDVITAGGFADQNLVDNAPFCKDGKVALLDTEIFQSWPIDYNKMTHYFSKKNRHFWVHLFAPR